MNSEPAQLRRSDSGWRSTTKRAVRPSGISTADSSSKTTPTATPAPSKGSAGSRRRPIYTCSPVTIRIMTASERSMRAGGRGDAGTS
jgi:hypothetical protein